MTRIFLSKSKSTLYLEPCLPDSSLREKLFSVVSFYENPNLDVLSVPLNNSVASLLRRELTGEPISLDPEVGQFLGSLADKQVLFEGRELFLSHDGSYAILNTQYLSSVKFSILKHLQSQRPEMFKIIDNNADIYRVDLDFINILIDAIPSLRISEDLDTLFTRVVENKISTIQNNLLDQSSDMELSNDVAKEVVINDTNVSSADFQKVTLPNLKKFPQYDGTLLSLKNVPLSEYDFLKKDLASFLEKKKKAEKTKKKFTGLPMYKQLEKFGLKTAFDILHHFPLRHMNRSNPKLIRNLRLDEEAAIIGKIVSKGVYNRIKHYIKFIIEDMSGARISVTFFRQSYLQFVFHEGEDVILTGKFDLFNHVPSLKNAKMDKIGHKRSELPMIPVYKQSDKMNITSFNLLELQRETLARMASEELLEVINETKRDEYRIPQRHRAYFDMHFPSNPKDYVDASRRLIYDELLRLQIFIQEQKVNLESRVGIVQDANKGLVDKYVAKLPYKLTGAQERAQQEIIDDMRRETPMHRLIQGDVGSGKTVIASMTVLNAVQNELQGALMAPTEILAEQLHNGIIESCEGLINPYTNEAINIKFLGGKTKIKERREIIAGLADGSIDILVGTHALIVDDVKFKNLGVVVIDEQHRFGVEQRQKLRISRTDGLTPDMMLMTATPVPRSSSMVLYGDLDITVLDELPPGRTPINTIWVDTPAVHAVDNPRFEIWSHIRSEVENGRQAYIVASLVQDKEKNNDFFVENEKLAAQSVEDAYYKLRSGGLAGLRVNFIHGQQKRADREAIMKEYSEGNLDVLIATTVIEVGVNVPNASIMVILDPGRFGIAQLHQIRGRVGRGKHASTCYLVGAATTDDGVFRLNALVASTDGFYLAEKDLELRGEGSLFNNFQSGDNDLYLASVRKNYNVLEIAKKDAELIVNASVEQLDEEYKRLLNESRIVYAEKEIKS